MAQRIKLIYSLKLTAREMIFVDDGLRALYRHLSDIKLLRDRDREGIALIRGKIKEELKK
jgi:hypothetical protein